MRNCKYPQSGLCILKKVNFFFKLVSAVGSVLHKRRCGVIEKTEVMHE